MNQALALDILSKIMKWDMDRARQEDDWLRLMSRIKYDGYQDFLAGARFIESLAYWLQQFDPSEREVAYRFVRNHLVYIGPAEMQHLVELMYPETVQPQLLLAVANRVNIPYYRVWAHENTAQAYNLLLRKSLFLGLSDGARIDTFRRANAGTIGNEQIVLATQIDKGKWDDLLKNLRRDLGDESARFSFIYLIDDFIGSGKTLLRNEGGGWKGKLLRFHESAEKIIQTHFEPDYLICVHHYIATHKASQEVPGRYQEAIKDFGEQGIFPKVCFSFTTILPEDLPIAEERYGDFMKLVDKYYDPSIIDEHLNVGGTDVRLGFGSCALPVVLEHNTPNNSVTLLWAETDGNDTHHPMRPLFRRRHRHS